MDMSYSKEHIDLFVIASGDSDFSPLVSKLKENDKYVIGVGVKNSSSDLLIDNCDEFIFYEDLVRGVQAAPEVPQADKKQAECFRLLIDSIKALMRENKEILWGSMVKQTMQRKKPTFNEEYYGYDTFSDLLEDAQNKSLIKIKTRRQVGKLRHHGLRAASVVVRASRRLGVQAQAFHRGAVPSFVIPSRRRGTVGDMRGIALFGRDARTPDAETPRRSNTRRWLRLRRTSLPRRRIARSMVRPARSPQPRPFRGAPVPRRRPSRAT